MTASIHAGRRSRRWSVSFARLFRAGLATLLLCLLPVVANAYTLVLRSGRLVNVSDKFKATPTTITYEASPGYWVTVWLSNVDIPATERANREPPGSFFEKLKQESEVAPNAPKRVLQDLKAERGAKPKVVTNKELEPARLTREAQEEEYERTRRKRGMPSRQEARQSIVEHDRWLSEWAQRMREERREAELESLKSELANVRLQLEELSLNQSRPEATYAPAYAPYYPYFYAPPAQVITVIPYGHRGLHGHWKFGRHTHGRTRTYQPRPGHIFRPLFRPAPSVGALPRATPPLLGAPGYSR